MSVSVPTDQVPVIRGTDVRNERQWQMTLASGAPGSGIDYIVGSANKKKGVHTFTASFRLYKLAGDLVDTTTPRLGTSDFPKPTGTSAYVFIGATVNLLNENTVPQRCELVETWQATDSDWSSD